MSKIENITDRQLLETILANQVQLFHKLNILEDLLSDVGRKLEILPNGDVTLFNGTLQECVNSILLNVDSNLSVLNKKLNQ